MWSPVTWRCTADDWRSGLSFQGWRNVEILKQKLRIQVRWGYYNSSQRKAFSLSWVLLPLPLFKPSLARRKISSPPQHASLSLVKFQDYTIIHPTQEAEEDTWAAEVTSERLYRHWLSIYTFSKTEEVPHSERGSCLSICSGSGL